MAMLRQAQRSLAKTDVATFIEYVTGQEPAAHHREMLTFAMDIIDRKASGVMLAPRGSGKTTIITTGLLPWLIALRPDIRIGLFSQKAEKAEAMSAAIMEMVGGGSEAFIEVFGNLRGSHKWTASEWLRKDSPHSITKDRTMVTGGAAQSSSAVSKRFDLLVLDDPLDENNTATIDQREKFATWFWKTLKPTQAAEGCAVLVIGTRWCEDDAYQGLIETNKWPSLVIPAITVDENETEHSYWPEVWPLDRLYAEREDVGWDNFACSYLNDISGLREGTIFRRDWWKDMYFENLPSGRDYVYTMGVDLATSVQERADWTALVIAARDNQGEHWILHHDRMKTDSGHLAFVEAGARWASERGLPVSRIIVENNQAQEAIVKQMQMNSSLPIVGRRTDTDKRARARAAQTRYEAHRVHHHERLRGRELETEMLAFDKGHDDLVDALGLSMDLSAASGTILGVNGPLRSSESATGPSPLLGQELPFLDGTRLVPAHVVSMLSGIDTERLSYEQAVTAMNSKRLNDYISGLTKGMLRGR